MSLAPASKPGTGAQVTVRDPSSDLELLLRAPGLGPGVVRRLEQVGVRSLSDLVRRGVDPTVAAICAMTGHQGWANRRGALTRALIEVARRPPS